MIDLHTHSRCSDGSDAPAVLARRAAEIGLTAVALTDHDTTAGHAEFSDACREVGVTFVAGVEVSLRDAAFARPGLPGEARPLNIHVLAYFVPAAPDRPLQRQLARLREDRATRNRALIALLQSQGFTGLTEADLVKLSGSIDSAGRPHFARLMTERHPELVGPPGPGATQRIFDEWLGSGGRAYIPKTDRSVEEFIADGRGDGVVFAIAHPLLNYGLRTTEEIATRLPGILASLRDRGLQGVEAHYGSWDASTRAQVAAIAEDLGLVATGGSDYHGAYKPDVALGVGRTGDLAVPDTVLEALRARRS